MKVARTVWTLAKSERIARDEEELDGIELTIGSTLSGSIDSETDTDLYHFTITDEDIYLMFTTSDFDAELTLMDTDMNEIQYDDDGIEFAGDAQIVITLGVGSYYLEVGGWSSSTGSYQVTLQLD